MKQNPLYFIYAMLRIICLEKLKKNELHRTPEPTGITSGIEQVFQYEQVMKTKLVINYALALQMLYRIQPKPQEAQLLDLACGPGVFTLLMKKYLGLQSVLGIDLSENGIAAALRLSETLKVSDTAEFKKANILDMSFIQTQSQDITSFSDAAHHLQNLKEIKSVVSEMERVTRPEGLIFIMDLARFKSHQTTEDYVKVLGHDYHERDLPEFYKDFRYSMFAAWTIEELSQIVPTGSKRTWFHIYPRLLPTLQMIVGLPYGREKLFIRSGKPWSGFWGPVPQDFRLEWSLAQLSFLSPIIRKLS